MTSEKEQHVKFFALAGQVASKALCHRDRCGAIIVQNGKVIGKGYNAPPLDDITNRKCDLDLRISTKPKSDRTCCLHAEWRVIKEALESGVSLSGSTLYFARIDETGALKRSGDPYCTVCSRLALDAGIAYFALWQKDGFRIFPTDEYNDRSYDFHQQANILK